MAAQTAKPKPRDDDQVLVCAIVGQERYLITFYPHQIEEAIHQVGHWAADDRLVFSWSDANSMVAMMKYQAAVT